MPYTYPYPRPALTVDCCIFRKWRDSLEILLICRDQPPFEGIWALPGGFIGMEETLREAAQRELFEETGLSGIELTQVRAFDRTDRDPRGRTISIVFTGYLRIPSARIKASSDARDARWFGISNLPHLAFDHKEILDYIMENPGLTGGK